jgi:hypothetical protein
MIPNTAGIHIATIKMTLGESVIKIIYAVEIL